jgi:2-polyprenyl-3-methyl-5-hydroxy-6-metoxy-1,4-benzoquinol methylase
MMFGTRERFAYYICVDCGTLQIVDVLSPEELGRHYRTDYYSYRSSDAIPKFIRWLISQQDRYELRTGRSAIGALCARLPSGIRALFGGPTVRMLGQHGVERHARIIDVGCGSGTLLDRLAQVGFDNLCGADPFIEADTESPAGVKLLKRELSDVAGSFDVIMFNHSLEHVPDLIGTLEAATELLTPGGFCLVRLPTTSSEAWSTYGEDWVLFDAPRHFVIPSRRGMSIAAQRVGLRVDDVIDDSNSYQFFASELIRSDVALVDMKGLGYIIRRFGLKQLWEWERRSEQLNQRGAGEQAGFVLKKAV